jgi:predicted RNase H-like nuclease (RuvC/YqgF family)
MFHNQNLGTANIQLTNENQMLKENCDSLQRFVEELQHRGDGINADSKRKLEYLQRDIQEYQKREDMFSKEI